MEYKVHKLPKEDLVIFLHLPAEIGARLAEGKGKRDYLGERKDINETDLAYLQEAEKMYLSLEKRFSHWIKIECLDKKGKLCPPEKVHERIIGVLAERGIIKEALRKT